MGLNVDDRVDVHWTFKTDKSESTFFNDFKALGGTLKELVVFWNSTKNFYLKVK